MKFKTILMAGSIAAALIAAPALGAQLKGEIVSVGTDTITIMSGGETITLMVPGSVQVQTPSQQKVDLAKLRTGQRVTLTVDDETQGEAQGEAQKRSVRDIIIEGDVNVDSEVENDSD